MSATRKGFSRPGAFFIKTRGVLLVPTCFLLKRAAFSSPRCVFAKNAGRFPRPGAFSAKTRGVFLASACFLPKREPFCSSRRVFCQNARRFACHGVFSVKTRTVFPATKHFLRKRRWRDFRCGHFESLNARFRAFAALWLPRGGESPFTTRTHRPCAYLLFSQVKSLLTGTKTVFDFTMTSSFVGGL